MAPRPWVCGKVSPLLIARVGHLQLHVGLFPFTVYVKHGGQCQYKYELFYKCMYQYLNECVEPERTNSTISAAATRILLTQTKKKSRQRHQYIYCALCMQLQGRRRCVDHRLCVYVQTQPHCAKRISSFPLVCTAECPRRKTTPERSFRAAELILVPRNIAFCNGVG